MSLRYPLAFVVASCLLAFAPPIASATEPVARIPERAALPSGGPRIAEARIARGVDRKTTEAVSPTTTFRPSDKAVYCIGKFAGAPPGTRLRGRWIAAKVKDLKPGVELWTSEITGGGKRVKFFFSLDPHGRRLPVGDYRLELFVNPPKGAPGKMAMVLPFQVKAGK